MRKFGKLTFGNGEGLGAFAEVAAGEDAAVAERAFGDVGLGVEDEDVGGIAEAGFFPAGEDGYRLS